MPLPIGTPAIVDRWRRTTLAASRQVTFSRPSLLEGSNLCLGNMGIKQLHTSKASYCVHSSGYYKTVKYSRVVWLYSRVSGVI